ncbi:hypothetical protein [Natrinema soli]|uniref:DUF8160 domain-containing protein n=1 Tax=Natrinema soli TaxID=1930624 RepID=A0ABD5SPC1_9EURY|nr:hypothetical protein [Natrinema soli]
MSEKHDRDPFNARYDRDDTGEQTEVEGDSVSETSNSSKTSEKKKKNMPKEGDVPSDSSETSKTSKKPETSESSNSDESSGTSKSGGDGLPPVRERKNINMYIADDDLVEDFKLRYQELNLQWQREHGEELAKNDDFYPALLRSALNETTIAEELDLD